MNIELLKELYSICSKSGSEDEIREFLGDYITNKYPDILHEEDNTGNIYFTKGNAKTYPCIVAHMDEVHRPNKNKQIVQHDSIIFGYDPVAIRPTGIGADDKNGIYVALDMLDKFDNLKVAFFVKEETGCQGSGNCDVSFFEDCRFIIQCDRRGNSDFINVASGVELCSEEFIKDIDIQKYGYKREYGLCTDVKELKILGVNVSCCNLSCGYYNPHSDTEATNLNDLEKCITLVEHIITDLTDVYPHKPVTKRRSAKSYEYIPYNQLMGFFESDLDKDTEEEIELYLEIYFETFPDMMKIPKYPTEFIQEFGNMFKAPYTSVYKLYTKKKSEYEREASKKQRKNNK